ncbi:Putative zn(2)-C6 fungal-type DNA-binding domain, fungal transcription factor [Septoria linicola]|uniref:Zn(2)-C6 fungal-type DNA-binding domain, fungal transcription factor n=1 Tax=Septoria linicola TaxID=215465 RepID=A0A9Q9EPH1_9PEZI|nr:putative zn(2)-C6 fungal-type DNA-binding domain, fungal transcription factor [Septoria linicola]USW57674.1 Putative zn(2)-C6 fungal-type DNA-binding domain, fungal transcription factor [Septoria linicola]
MQESRQEGGSGSSKQKRNHLPTLAPRDAKPAPTRDRAPQSSSTTGRTSRLSHRSRAGCWTCRGRKVKCDEAHPRCGPCTRLNRECAWDHRWNFSDATTNTQTKFQNVNTEGNAVWDPLARTQSTSPGPLDQPDDLPEFSVLTSDEERERKAFIHRPGTFGVVVTPESFHDLPEYASSAPSPIYDSRRTSAHSSRGGYGSPQLGLSRSVTMPADPNTVILDKFEDVSPITVFPVGPHDGFPETMQQLTITSPPYTPGLVSAPQTPVTRPNEPLIRHFRQYIIPRLVHPQSDAIPGVISQGSTKDVLEREAARFPPLQHAICAISALNLAYTGRSSLEEAMQNYHQALAAAASSGSANDMLSDGVFFRHYLLFVYDVCIPMQSDDDGTDMWAEHLNQLRRLAVQRHHHKQGRELNAYTIWAICELDMYACLMGSGTCEFVETIMQNNMLPSLDQQVPCLTVAQTSGAGAFMPHEAQVFPAVLRLNEGVVLRAAKIAQTAQQFRAAVSSHKPISPGRSAQWTAATAQAQHDLHNFWQQAIPPYLASESLQSASGLPDRVRTVFVGALLLYHATAIYTRTSMFPGQRQIPIANYVELQADTERRVLAILGIAGQQVEQGAVDQRNTVFAIFIAGVASTKGESKARAVDLIRAFEGHGIGQNTYRTRQLLVAVCEEQRLAASSGRRMQDVEWLTIARDRGLGVANCGL